MDIITPQKAVHWDKDMSLSDITGMDSPFPNYSSDSLVSTSSLEYINSQLVAHGFTPAPGLSLDGISQKDCERVIKCLLGMLSQRIEDMSRTEELSTKLRTLSYDHERVTSMHRAASDRAANAEREMNVFKSRLLATTRTLQSTEAAHRNTNVELQRTRTTLQAVRATHQSEIKKKEKDIERVVEKWSKLLDQQGKLAAVNSTMSCTNIAVVEGNEVLGKGQGYLEIALEQAEAAQKQLWNENTSLKQLVLKAVNEIQNVLHHNRSTEEENSPDPTPFTTTTLFPLHPASHPTEKLGNVLAALRERFTTLSLRPPQVPPLTQKLVPSVPEGEVERLQNIINTLRAEIERSQKQHTAHAVDTQAMFDQFARDHRIKGGEIGDISVELMSGPLRDAERERLEKIKQDLDDERNRFTEAAIKFGKEKAALEAERVRLQDEKRAWQVEMMLADLPATPMPASPARTKVASLPSPKKSPRKSPRKSPQKIVTVGKAGGSRKVTRVSRRSSLMTPTKVIPSYETEVIPQLPLPAPSFTFKPLPPLSSSLLPTSFVLPPPSPRASLPSKPALPPPSSSTSPPVEAPSIPQDTLKPLPPLLASTVPSTPIPSRPFPVAKPFATRMIHAYSPAKPSPLSRILMLANSPNADTSAGLLAPVSEEGDHGYGLGGEDSSGERDMFPPLPPIVVSAPEIPQQGQEQVREVVEPITPPQQMSLAAELGVESPPETPLQEKKVEINVTAAAAAGAAAKRRLTAHEKGKGKVGVTIERKVHGTAVGAAVVVARGGTRVVEKENNASKRGTVVAAVATTAAGATVSNGTKKVISASRVSPPMIGESRKPVVSGKSTTTVVSRARAGVTVPVMMVGGKTSGPRRVPIDSAEAPPPPKAGWRG